MAYDANGQLLTRTTSLTASDSAVAISTYDAAGRLLTQTQSDAPTVAYAYDLAGNMTLQSTDPSGLAITTSRQYDSVGRVTRSTQPDSTYQVSLYDAFGHVTKAIAYDSSSNRLAVTGQFYDDHLGVVTRSYQISSPSTTDTFNSTNDPYSDALYTSAGRLTKTIDPLSHATTYDYDGLGRRITTTDPVGNKVVPLYDNADRLMTQVRLDYDGTNYTTFKTAYEYNFRGQVTKTIDQGPDGDITAATDNLTVTQWYDALGRVTQTQDTAGQQTAFLFDKLGQLTRTTEDSGGGGVARYTDRAYDRAGRMTRLTGYPVDATNAQNTDYAYSKASVQTRVTYPDDSPGSSRGYVVYSYDAALRLTRINHQDDTNTDVVYDSMGRRLTLTKGSEIDTFGYAATGQLTRAGRSGGSYADVQRSYDGLGRLTRENQLGAENVDYAYDKAGNVLTLTYPNVRYDSPGSMAVQTTYDALGRALTVKRDGSVLASYHYVGARPKSQTFETGANDVTLNMTYDGASGGRLTRMAYSQTGNTSLPDFTYAFDSASDITRKTFNNQSGANEDYAYDTLNRLTRTTFGQRTSTPYKGYIYDDQGNHLTQDDNGTTIAGLFNAVNEQTKRGVNDILYDSRGNLTKDDSGKAYYYDRQNMLTRVDDSSGNLLISYQYDAFNRLVSKEAVGWPAGVSFVYDGWRRLEEHPGGEPVAGYCYIWAPGRAGYIDDLICYIRNPADSNITYFPCRNHNFSVTAMLTTAGAVVERYDYNPYGERLVLDPDYSNDSDNKSDIINPIGFQGLCHDDESGLIYVRNRYLNTALGRWMTSDPLGYADCANMYAYVGNNPIVWFDPEGTKKNCQSLNISKTIHSQKQNSTYLPGPWGTKIKIRTSLENFSIAVSGTKCECCDSQSGAKGHTLQGIGTVSLKHTTTVEWGYHLTDRWWKFRWHIFAGAFGTLTAEGSGSLELNIDECNDTYSMTAAITALAQLELGVKVEGQFSAAGIQGYVEGKGSINGQIEVFSQMVCNKTTCTLNSGMRFGAGYYLGIRAGAEGKIWGWDVSYAREWALTGNASSSDITLGELTFDNPVSIN